MANAHLERVPVLLIGGCPPVPQDDLGPLQGIDHAGILAPVTRWSRTLRVAEQGARATSTRPGRWRRATATRPGLVRGDPTDVLRQTVHPAVVLDEHLAGVRRPPQRPDAALVEAAAALLRAAGVRWSSPVAAPAMPARR